MLYSETHRERKTTKEKWSEGKLGIQDASCQWSRIHLHRDTHTHADTIGEFLMSEDLTGDTEVETVRKGAKTEGKLISLSSFHFIVCMALCVCVATWSLREVLTVKISTLHSIHICIHTHI